MNRERVLPDYIFEVSWEICNKVGGIHTVISTKALSIEKEYGDKYILLGPDVWRESSEHPEFAEDKTLLSTWRKQALSEGLNIRIGRWRTAGNPIVVLVDFTPFFNKKDVIFSELWEQYKLDSITGQWDYIEPSLFGYASGKVIESYVRYYLTSHDRVIAQFHEWMTGAGLLYLKKAIPQVGTIFTTHATVIGRAIAANNQPLYSKMDGYDGDVKATEFQAVSKQSMEKISALNADSFTTVSELTSRECKQFLKKEVDIITPNGFEDSFVPDENNFDEKRKQAKNLLLKVASALVNEKLPDETFLIANSGRYEYRNKGIDLFIRSLGSLNKSKQLKKNIVAFILIPSNHYGPRKDLIEKLKDSNEVLTGGNVLTHNLHYSDYDPIMKAVRNEGLSNKPEDQVKIVFVPSYLNGDDGIFNKSYYDLLIGMDLTVFPSYYEPWGYTPLESLAFHIPTITTSLAGFGLWVNNKIKDPGNGIFVLNRNDFNGSEVSEGIAEIIDIMSGLDEEKIGEARKKAYEVSRIALWSNFIEYYRDACNIALLKVAGRVESFVETQRIEHLPEVDTYREQRPRWRKVIVQQNIPQELKPLEELSKNIWWDWNPDAVKLFESVDNELWEECRKNPIEMLDRIPYSRLLRLEKNEDFRAQLTSVYERYRNYIDSAKYERPEIAYFSMEFGLLDSLKIYSGGLGLLAGDYLKEASDHNCNLVGLGLLYRFGYFRQELSASGEQISISDPLQFSKMPVTPVRDDIGNWKEISVVLPGRELKARIWRADVGRVRLYLLDTDFEENTPQDRTITHQLYGGDNENRFKQEILLGIGGIRALRTLGYDPDLFHCNEGHAAFIGLERLREYIEGKNLTYPEALEIVRASTLFTTHTPVPAGHDYFDENMLRTYMSHYPARLRIDWDHFMNLGKMHPNKAGEKFSMSCLAVNLSRDVNGVSKLHGEVSRNMFKDMWKGYLKEEVPIGYVTNGVHLPTWVSDRWRELYTDRIDPDFMTKQEDRDLWKKIYKVDQEDIWKIRNAERKDLIHYVKERLIKYSARSNQNPKLLLEIQEKLDPKTLTIGFARRFATYKRANLLFRDPDRLASIVNNPFMPVQFLFAGKAHPADKAGQDLIKTIVEISKTERFRGKIIFLENYEIPLGKKLVRGVDIWLNTPTRPLEASGTSGEKGIMNGVLHFSVLDGWWAEGYKPGAGWALDEERFYENQDFQDQLDAETIYSIIEDEIAPLFYKRDEKGVPKGWISMIQKSISSVAPEFTMNRMLRDYIARYYTPLFERSLEMQKNRFELASKLAAWKHKVLNVWNEIEVISVAYPDLNKIDITLGHKYDSELVLDLKTLTPEEIGVELIVGDRKSEDSEVFLIAKQEFKVVKNSGSKVWYSLKTTPVQPGIFDYGIRIYPKNESLAERYDFTLVRWI